MLITLRITSYNVCYTKLLRGKGIKSFCFTIDKQAHDYLEHMYGRGNYTFINNIEKLPSRIPQIYRTLTA